MAQKSTAAAAVAVAVAVASFQMVGGKCLIPWRAPPCVGRGRRISESFKNHSYTNKLFLFRSHWCLAVTARYGGYDPGYDPGLIWFSTHFSEVAVFTEICWLPETCTETSDVSIDLTCRTFFVQKVLKYIETC